MKALEKDRTRRYETANALALDLQRHLDNEPVVARPPSKLYEFQKTVRRHKVGFAATAAVIVALAGGVVVSLWEAAQARRAEREARRSAYVADMHVARQALTEGNLGGTRELLAKYLPASGAPDLRGWEWRNLAHASRGDQAGYLVGHRSFISDLCFLDKDRLLSVGWDGRIICWDLPRRSAAYTLTNTVAAQRHALSRDRRTVALTEPLYAETNGLNVILLEPATRTQRTLPTAFRGAHLALDFSPAGNLAIGNIGGVSLWDGNQLRTLVSFPTNQFEVDGIQFTPDGRRLAVAKKDGRIDQWELAEGSCVWSAQAHQPEREPFGRVAFDALRFSPDGRWLVSSGAGSDLAVRVWNAETGERIAELVGHHHVASPAGVLGMGFSPDGRWLATAGGDQTVRVWETGSWTNREIILRGHSDPVFSVAWSPDSRHLVSGGFSGELLLWDWPGPSKAAERIAFSGKSYFVGLAADTRVVFRVAETNLPVTAVWDPRRLELTARFPTPPLPMISYGLALPGDLVATGETNGMVRLWDTTGREVVSRAADPNPVVGLACSADGQVLVSRSSDEQVRVWSLPGLTLRDAFQLERPRAVGARLLASALALSADGSRLAIGLTDGRVELRHLPGGQRRTSWVAHTMRPIAIAFSPDNRLLATGGDDFTAAVWDLAGPRLLAPLKGNPLPVNSVVFTPDGLQLALGLGDGTVKLCHAQTGVETASFHGHSQPVSALAFVPGGTELISLSKDALCVWRAPALRDLADVEMRLKSLQTAPGQ
jgi:WD40 repeat protein